MGPRTGKAAGTGDWQCGRARGLVRQRGLGIGKGARPRDRRNGGSWGLVEDELERGDEGSESGEEESGSGKEDGSLEGGNYESNEGEESEGGEEESRGGEEDGSSEDGDPDSKEETLARLGAIKRDDKESEGEEEESGSGEEDGSSEDSWAEDDDALGGACVSDEGSAGYESEEETLAHLEAIKGKK